MYMKKFMPYVVLFVFTLLLFLPVLVDGSLFWDRGNDLTEFFYPLIYYSKHQLLTTATLPYWNNMFMSGSPLLPDPQSPNFYLPNVLFLLTSVKSGLLISSILHTFVGGIGMYLFAKYIIKLETKYALVSGVIYLTIPRTASFIQAGHFGLIASTAYIPFILLFLFQIIKSPKLKYSILFAITLAGLFFTHPTTFVFSAVLSCMVFIGSTILHLRLYFRSYIYFTIAGILTFGLTAISFLPQLVWIPQTNRYLLSTTPDVYPKYNSAFEYLKLIIAPWTLDNIQIIDNEKIIAVGIIATTLSVYGFIKFKLNFVYKIMILLLGGFIFLIAANNASPIYSLLLEMDWYVFGRVSTRIWFVVLTMVSIFASIGLSKIINKSLFVLITSLLLIELLYTSWLVIRKPIKNDRVTPSIQVYEYLSQDKEIFRVFCTSRCFQQDKVAEFGLQTIGGYSTLQQQNFYQAAWVMTGVYWDYYTLAIPPIGTYKFGKLNPDYSLLGEYNTKYVISPYEIINDNIDFEIEIDGFYIYRNLRFEPRVISINKQNQVDFEYESAHEMKIKSTEQLLVGEVYNSGWKATDDRGIAVTVQESPNGLIYLDSPNSKYLTLYYLPNEYELGRTITIFTLMFSLLVLAIPHRKAG